MMEKLKYSILNLYPSTKFFFALFIGISAFLVPSYWYGFAGFLFCIVIAFIVGEGVPFLKVIRNTLLILAVFMFVMRALFSGGTDVVFSFWTLEVTTEGIQMGLSMVSKVLALGTALLLFFRITPIKEITAALEAFGMSPSATYVVLSAIQMIPEMRKQSNVIMDAQKTRGVETEGKLSTRMKAFVPTLGPLVLSSIASTEERVITLEARAFTAPVQKTRLFTVQKEPIDKVITTILFIALILLLVGRVLLWML